MGFEQISVKNIATSCITAQKFHENIAKLNCFHKARGELVFNISVAANGICLKNDLSVRKSRTDEQTLSLLTETQSG